MLAEIIILLLIILAVVIILSFVASSFTESIVLRVTDWCLKKMEAYETKDAGRFSISGITKTFCSIIVRTFNYIDKIENSQLRTGLKLHAVTVIVSITLALLSFLLIAFFYITITLIALYLSYRLFYRLVDLWYRYEKGLPLFPDKDNDYYEVKTSWRDKFAGNDRKTVYNSEGDKVGDISKSALDKFAGKDRQTIRDAEGNKFGDINKSALDKFAGKDRQTIRDAEGDKVGNISKSALDKFAGKDRQTIRDAKGDKLGDINRSPSDEATQIIRMKKDKD